MKIFRRLWSWLSRRWRYRQRSIDCDVLWTVMWHQSGYDSSRFLAAATLHIVHHPEWRDHLDEWKLSPVDPTVWLQEVAPTLRKFQ